MTLAEFYAARLDEDETVAKEALLGFPLPGDPEIPADRWYASYHEVVQRMPVTGEHGPMPKATHVADCGMANVYPARHIARHDPARVLRDVEAGRKLLRLYQEAVEVAEPVIIAVIEGIICDQAAVYSGHPDYREVTGAV